MDAYQDITHTGAAARGIINTVNTHANAVGAAGEEAREMNNYVNRRNTSAKTGELVARKPENK